MSGEHFIKCLEWCTKLPAEDCPFEMPISLQHGCKCMFRFALEKLGGVLFYALYVEMKSEHSKWEPCDVKLFAGFKNEQQLSLPRCTYNITGHDTERVWCMETNELRAKLPSDYVDGNWIKFRFCFDDMTSKKIVDKYIQTSSFLNEYVSVQSLNEDLAKLLETGAHHDVEIKCREHLIKAHKSILCTRSEVLKAILESDMVEGRTGVIEMKDMDIKDARDFVKYLYTEKMPEMTFEKAKILYEAGDKYAVQSLMLRCSQYLQDNLSQENAF